ncbi:extracellular solute-binding protein [Marinivivus vitaminiproducens]|uniref:extracellular solute-binding protein n=1 Tax=Marinivivus vitaminiproducens TaxID=3035935 RepID=UPI00279A10E6|nr:extracellular solute-binding protein [Geminicoccaceae bacterium SCSIO 64248]
MARVGRRDLFSGGITRRTVLKSSAAAALAAGAYRPLGTWAQGGTGIDLSQWSPDYVRSIAGTLEVDTAAECARVVPLDYTGRLTYWWVGPTEASPQLDHETDAQFWEAFSRTYPNITIERQNLGYNDMLNKLRTAALGNAAPMVARLPILWGVEFAAKGQLSELKPEDIGYGTDEYWPGALKSVTWDGAGYGIPTNNETMAFIWNAEIFKEAGLDPETPPATWDDVVAYSRQIKEKTGKNGYGLVARPNAGNTPFRFMPQCWAYGGGALDEAEADPSYEEVYIGNDGTKAALQLSYDMYVRDRSVPTSALTNTQTENQDPFIAGQLGMMISHPSEYAFMIDRANRATGSDKAIADAVVANMRYGLIPQGPVRRAVVFGGSNVHMFHPDVVDGDLDVDAARALITFMTGPEWSTRYNWSSSNPGNIRGFRTSWMKERLDQIKFLDVTSSMLPSGIPFPVIPESTEIMNIIIPDMLQNALTETMSIEDAADDAAYRVQQLLDGI